MKEMNECKVPWFIVQQVVLYTIGFFAPLLCCLLMRKLKKSLQVHMKEPVVITPGDRLLQERFFAMDIFDQQSTAMQLITPESAIGSKFLRRVLESIYINQINGQPKAICCLGNWHHRCATIVNGWSIVRHCCCGLFYEMGQSRIVFHNR